MNSKIYKSIYVVFNLFFFLLILIIINKAEVIAEIYTAVDNGVSSNSGFSFETIISFLPLLVYGYFLVRALLNIVTKKQHNKKWKTILFRILSIIMWGVPIFSLGYNLLNEYTSDIPYYNTQLYILGFGMLITFIIITLSFYYLFKNQKETYSKTDIISIFITFCFIILIFVIFNINGNFTRIGTNNQSINFKDLTLIYYMCFILVPIQLVNLYNLFNLKAIKKEKIKTPNMIQIKNVILGALIIYVLVISGLFIKQTYKFNNKMNQKINFETKEYYEEFIKESKAKLREYRGLSTTREEQSCLNEVDKMIDISYVNQHPKAKTYIELMDAYYDKTEEEKFYNFQNIKNVCKFEQKSINSREVIKKYMGNLVILEEEFLNSRMMYQIDIKFDDYFTNTIAVPALESMKENTEQSLRGRIIRNEINMIELVLDLVGEDYE